MPGNQRQSVGGQKLPKAPTATKNPSEPQARRLP
jgi:hypothetical protein